MAEIDDAIKLQRAAMAAISELPPDLQKFAPGVRSSVNDVIKGAAGLAPELSLVDLSDVARDAETLIAQPTETVRRLTTDYLGKFVSEAVTAALIEGLGTAIGTAVFPGVGSVAGQLAATAVNGIISELTKKNVDPFVENDGAWIPEVEHVLDQWCVKPSDVRRPDGGYDGYWNHDRNLTRTTWDGGPLNGVTTPWTIRRWMGDCLHNMSKSHGPGMGVGSLLGMNFPADSRDNAHSGWGGDWWIDPSISRTNWEKRVLDELHNAVHMAAIRRANESTARAAIILKALHNTRGIRAAQSISANVGAFAAPPRRPAIGVRNLGGLALSPALLNAIGAAQPAATKPNPLASFAAIWNVARLPEFVAYYCGGGTAGHVPPPRES